MADVLYRKYRPRSFADVHGQEIIVKTIQYAFVSGKNPHAYLLVGPRGTGKTTLARLMAKAANCENLQKHGDVCNDCPSCIAVDKGSFPDVIEIDAASNRGIDEIRQLRDSINFLPAQGKKKVYVIDEVHMLTKEAFNALLKTLEEPPAHTLFVLATTEPHKVPITISSRLQRFDLSLATAEQLLAKLRKIIDAEGVKVGDDVLQLIFEHTEGSYRDAESLLGKILAIAGDDGEVDISEVSKLLGIGSLRLVEQIVQGLLGEEGSTVISLLDDATAQGVDLLQLAKQVANSLRKSLHSDDSVIDSQFLKVVNGLVQLQADARVIDDIRLLWDVFVLNACADSAKLARKSDASPRRPKGGSDHSPKRTAKPRPDTPTRQDDRRSSNNTSQPDLPVELGSREFDADELLANAKQRGFKLWTILRGCSFELVAGQLVVKTRFDYNYKFLQQLTNQVELQRIASTYGVRTVAVFKSDEEKFSELQEEESPEIIEVLAESNADLVESIL